MMKSGLFTIILKKSIALLLVAVFVSNGVLPLSKVTLYTISSCDNAFDQGSFLVTMISLHQLSDLIIKNYTSSSYELWVNKDLAKKSVPSQEAAQSDLAAMARGLNMLFVLSVCCLDTYRESVGSQGRHVGSQPSAVFDMVSVGREYTEDLSNLPLCRIRTLVGVLQLARAGLDDAFISCRGSQVL